MKFIAGSGVLLILSTGSLFGCSRSVHVEKIRNDPTVAGGSTITTLPGFSNEPYVSPTVLGNAECTEETNANIIVYGGAPVDGGAPPTPQIGRFPATGNGFAAFWTICNASKVAQPAGSTYVLSIQTQQVNSTVPGNAGKVNSPFQSVTLNIPQLDACTCYVQEVGINQAIPQAATQQQNLQNKSISFPNQTVPPEAPPAPPLSFQYVAALPDKFGVGVLAFQVN